MKSMNKKIIPWLESLRDSSNSIQDEFTKQIPPRGIESHIGKGKIPQEVFKFENTKYFLKPYWEVFDRMIRKYKSGKVVRYRLKPKSKTQTDLGDLF